VWLTEPELVDLTHRSSPGWQANALRQMGIPFIRGGGGSVCVSRGFFEHPRVIEDDGPVEGVMMDARQAREWLKANWRPLYQSLDVIRSRSVDYPANSLPTASGVYFLFAGGELQYVGKAFSLCRRVWAHFTGKRFPWWRVAWIECTDECNEELEYFYIHSLNPPMNIYRRAMGHYMQSLVDDPANCR
jgi:hypothetical protein